MNKLILTGVLITVIASNASAMMAPTSNPDVAVGLQHPELYMFIEDENEDGMIFMDELERHISLTCGLDDVCRSKYEDSFNKADKNNDGYINIDERNVY